MVKGDGHSPVVDRITVQKEYEYGQPWSGLHDEKNAIFSGESRGFEPSDQDALNGLGVKRSQVQVLSPRLVGAGRPLFLLAPVVDGWRGDVTRLVIARCNGRSSAMVDSSAAKRTSSTPKCCRPPEYFPPFLDTRWLHLQRRLTSPPKLASCAENRVPEAPCTADCGRSSEEAVPGLGA
jgi:hypothetical protein